MTEIRNAVVERTFLGFEDHGILTAFLHLDYGGVHQGFGGYNLDAAGQNYAALFIRRCLETCEVGSWDALKGKSIRVRGGGVGDREIEAIGHFIKDKWFCPKEEIKKLENGKVFSEER